MPDSSSSSTAGATFTAVGLFAGIGGLELGFKQAGASTKLLCEVWAPAQTVLRERFPDVPLWSDVGNLRELPDVDVVSAGFPCTDLSQAGRMAGIQGEASGLVRHLFELLKDARPRWVVIENVRNMLVLDRGRAMRYDRSRETSILPRGGSGSALLPAQVPSFWLALVDRLAQEQRHRVLGVCRARARPSAPMAGATSSPGARGDLGFHPSRFPCLLML